MGFFDGALGSVIGTVGNIAGTFLQNTMNKKAATKAYQREVELWNMNNEYNSPAMQVQRLKDAGLNPALIYGTGASVATGNSKGAAHAPQSAPVSAPKIDLLAGLQFNQDMKLKQAQIDQVEAATKKIKAEAFGTAWENLWNVVHNKNRSADTRSMLNRLLDYFAGNTTLSRAYRDGILSGEDIYKNMDRVERQMLQRFDYGGESKKGASWTPIPIESR